MLTIIAKCSCNCRHFMTHCKLLPKSATNFLTAKWDSCYNMIAERVVFWSAILQGQTSVITNSSTRYFMCDRTRVQQISGGATCHAHLRSFFLALAWRLLILALIAFACRLMNSSVSRSDMLVSRGSFENCVTVLAVESMLSISRESSCRDRCAWQMFVHVRWMRDES